MKNLARVLNLRFKCVHISDRNDFDVELVINFSNQRRCEDQMILLLQNMVEVIIKNQKCTFVYSIKSATLYNIMDEH